MRIAFLDDIHDAYARTAGVARLRAEAEVTIFTAPVALHALRGIDAIVATRERTHFTDDVLAQLPDVRVIAQTGNHAYHVDLASAQRRGIVVGKATGGFCGAAAELTFGLMMALMRQIPRSDAALKAGEWPTPMTQVLAGKTLGIVGLGRIGRQVARIADAFGMDVLAWGSQLTDREASAAGATRCGLDLLLQLADVVSIHATLNEHTRGLIDDARLRLMKRTAYLVNTARGALVDEEALVAALTERRIAGAGLDVFTTEPLPLAHPLRRLDNVVLTPHLGWPTDSMYAQFADAAADLLIAFQNGREIPQFRADVPLPQATILKERP